MSLSASAAIAGRRATRKYTDEPISDEVLDHIVYSALEAPSAFNLQRRDLVVVRNPGVKQKLFEASNQRQFLDAPVVFVVVARVESIPEDAEEILGVDRVEHLRGGLSSQDHAALREAAMKDASLVAGFLLIAAQAEGLATSPTTGWDEEKVKQAIGIGGREDRGIALVVAMGYPAETPAHPGRQTSRRVNDHY